MSWRFSALGQKKLPYAPSLCISDRYEVVFVVGLGEFAVAGGLLCVSRRCRQDIHINDAQNSLQAIQKYHALQREPHVKPSQSS
jgi:hypothetical protein